MKRGKGKTEIEKKGKKQNSLFPCFFLFLRLLSGLCSFPCCLFLLSSLFPLLFFPFSFFFFGTLVVKIRTLSSCVFLWFTDFTIQYFTIGSSRKDFSLRHMSLLLFLCFFFLLSSLFPLPYFVISFFVHFNNQRRAVPVFCFLFHPLFSSHLCCQNKNPLIVCISLIYRFNDPILYNWVINFNSYIL